MFGSQKLQSKIKKGIQQSVLKLILYIVQVCSSRGSLLMSWAHLHCRQYTAALPLPSAAAVQVSLIF